MSTKKYCERDIRACYRFLAHGDRGVTEVRVIAPGRGILGIGYFDREETFVRACIGAAGTGNVYVGIQPRPYALFERAPNRLDLLESGARDDDIEWVSSIVIDIKPIRFGETAATDEEVAWAIIRGGRIADWLAGKGVQRPMRAMGGNGCQLWFAVPPIWLGDGAMRDDMRARVMHVESRIRERFGDARVAIAATSHHSCIIKVPGTLSVKGEPTPERSHRLSRTLQVFQRREDAALRDALLRIPLSRSSAHRPKPSAEVASALSPRLQQLFTAKPRMRALFEGRGLTVLGPCGKPLERNSAGYDYSLALRLALMGTTSPGELAYALWLRPDGYARAQGLAYIDRTVRQALEVAQHAWPGGTADSVTASLPEIQVNKRPLSEIVIDAWAAVHAANNPPVLFVRQGVLMRLNPLSSEPIIEKASFGIVYGWLSRIARWVRVRGGRVVDAWPPKNVARYMRVRPDEALPDPNSVKFPPVPEGECLLLQPEYRPVARLW